MATHVVVAPQRIPVCQRFVHEDGEPHVVHIEEQLHQELQLVEVVHQLAHVAGLLHEELRLDEHLDVEELGDHIVGGLGPRV